MNTDIHIWSDFAQFTLEWDERCRENQNTRFKFSFFSLENRTVYEVT